MAYKINDDGTKAADGAVEARLTAELGASFSFRLKIDGSDLNMDDRYEIHRMGAPITFDNKSAKVTSARTKSGTATLPFKSKTGFTKAGEHTIVIRKVGSVVETARITVTVTNPATPPADDPESTDKTSGVDKAKEAATTSAPHDWSKWIILVVAVITAVIFLVYVFEAPKWATDGTIETSHRQVLQTQIDQALADNDDSAVGVTGARTPEATTIIIEAPSSFEKNWATVHGFLPWIILALTLTACLFLIYLLFLLSLWLHRNFGGTEAEDSTPTPPDPTTPSS